MAVYGNEAELLASMKVDMGGLADDIGDPRLSNGIDAALTELGFTYPLTGNKALWSSRRSKRHSIAAYILELASNFDVDQYKLSQEFKHFRSLIQDSDDAFSQAIEDDPALFAGADLTSSFGTAIDVTPTYDSSGKIIG